MEENTTANAVFATFMELHTFTERRLGVHLMAGCLTCINARRRSEMCGDGKTLYDDMIAAQDAQTPQTGRGAQPS